jgi:hypothetical protein
MLLVWHACYGALLSGVERVALLASAAGLALFCAAAPSISQDNKIGVWSAGYYSFSDELGGFTIDGVSGKGTHADPIILRETFASSSPVTLVIRANFYATGRFYSDGILYLRILTRNGSGQGWVEFEFELQELLHQASVFGDGLSFDQRNSERGFISSDSFAKYSRDFEPFDKLLFTNGKVDPGHTSGFSFLITDFTPRGQFYLLQDPRIPLM